MTRNGAGPDAQRLPIAVRAYAPPVKKPRPRRRRPEPSLVLVLDTETRTDAAQDLLFASYRVYRRGRLVQEGLVAGDGLTADERSVLDSYAPGHAADNGGVLRLRSRREFLEEVLWRVGYVGQARIVGFNLPFDLSRLAVGARTARNGGFSLRLFDRVAEDGALHPHPWRPELTVKSDGSKRAFIAFTTPGRLDEGNRDRGRPYRGRFVDLHTLAYALTDRSSLTLDGAAAAFGVSQRKAEAGEHGVLTPAYIDYNRQDVRTTHALYLSLTAEWARHAVDLDPEQGFSPAALAKSYLRAAGVGPPLAHRGAVSDEDLGHAMAAYFGGRAEVRIRRTPVPVRYVDFTSMYPTVFSLVGLWRHVVADGFGAADATGDARALLERIDRDSLLDPAAWRELAGVFCRVRPDGDLLPLRAPYGGGAAAALTIGLNRVSGEVGIWYPLADLVAAKLLSGRRPDVLEAVRIAPAGTAAGLRPVSLRGDLDVDPADDDLFRLAIEERQRVRRDPSRDAAERDRLERFLKTFANGGAYGVFAEYHRLEPVAGGVPVDAFGLFPLRARVVTPEEPGEFCWPPLAATVTAAARLLLALLQAEVEAAGGCYAACDTDSLLIVSSREGGLVPCPGGPHRMPDGREAVLALSWALVEEITARIGRLNPYDRSAVPSLLKLEDENLDPETGGPVELRAVAVSAKRYALYTVGPDGPVIRKASTHGLGLYRRPAPDPPGWDRPWPHWVEVVWDRIVREAEDLPLPPEPTWFAYPAVSQLAVSSPHVLAPFRTVNAGRPYAAQVKPFNFLLVGHADPLATLPDGVDPGVVPVAPYSTDAARLLEQPWRSRATGESLNVTTAEGGAAGAVRLRTYGDVVRDYRLHPEAKSGDPRGGPGHRGSTGLLPRLDVVVAGLPVHIGKESNRLEEVEGGVITDPGDVYVTYRDGRAEWEQVVPALRALRDERGWRYLANASGLSERAMRYALNSGRVPRREARDRLTRLASAEPRRRR